MVFFLFQKYLYRYREIYRAIFGVILNAIFLTHFTTVFSMIIFSKHHFAVCSSFCSDNRVSFCLSVDRGHWENIRCNIFCRGHGTNQNEIKNNDRLVSLVISMPMLNTHIHPLCVLNVCHNEPHEKSRRKKINKWNWNKMSNALLRHGFGVNGKREEICAIHFRLMCVSACVCLCERRLLWIGKGYVAMEMVDYVPSK